VNGGISGTSGPRLISPFAGLQTRLKSTHDLATCKMVGKTNHVFPNPLLPRIFRQGTRRDCFRRSFPRIPSMRAAPKRMVRRNSTHPSPDDRPGGEVDSTTYIAATRTQVISRLITVWDNQPATSTSIPALSDPCLSHFARLYPATCTVPR
jgi:hypothetical protein